MAANQQFCLRWNNHQRTLISVFDSLLESGTLVDCTLAAEGQYLKAHKVVLSACSPYLGVLLSSHHEKHPILILKDIKFQELKAMLDYMYRGEVNISQEQLGTFLKAAESLQIKGLTESAGLNPETKDFEERLVKRYDRKCPSGAAAASSLPNHSAAARVRSPPSANALTSVAAAAAVISEHAWSQKYAATANFRGACSSPPPPSRIRDGSLSPTARKRRKQQHPTSSSGGGGGCADETPLLPVSPLIATALNASITTATTTTTTSSSSSSTTHHGGSRGDSGVVENHQDAAAAASSADPLGEAAAANSVTSSNGSSSSSHNNHSSSSSSSNNSVSSNGSSANPLSMTMNSIKAEHTDKCNDNETRSTDSGNSSTTTTSSAKVNDLPVVPKCEPKYDDRQSDGEAAYEDSVEEMTLEDEEEEIDETDLSRPGPSHSEDSQNYGSSSYPLSSVNDSTSGQLDCQEPATDPLAEQRFVCRLCGKLYQWKQSLTRHIREDRCDKGPQHACPRCGIIFKHTTRLNRHILFCPSVQMNASEANAITTVADSIIASQSASGSLQSQVTMAMSQTTTLS